MERQWTEQDFLSCSGSTRFGREMAAAAPFPDLAAAVESARDIWFNRVDVKGWLESFAAHPAIGSKSKSISQWSKEEQSAAVATATDSSIQELIEWNDRYKEKFGIVFLICASGRSTSEILDELKRRYTNRPIVELEIAAQEDMKIIELRLARLFEGEARASPSVTTQLPISQPNKPADIKLYMPSQQRTINVCTPKMKAHWTPEFHKLFVSLCLEQAVAGNKPGTHLNKKGWKNVMDGFYEKTGIRYDKKQFKNHWDNTKDQWKVWNKLKNNIIESGWDQSTQSVNMSDEWWVDYLQIHPEAAQFRYKGLPLADLLDTLFSGIPAIEAITWAPSQGSLPNVDMPPSQTTPRQETNNGLPNMVPETHMRNQESPSFSQGEFDSEPPIRRRKMNDDLPSPIHQRTRDLGSIKLDRQLHRFCEVVESRSTATSAPREEYTIKECIGLLNEMSEVKLGSELYMFALDVFVKKEYRELFIALGMPNIRFAWLQRQQKFIDG